MTKSATREFWDEVAKHMDTQVSGAKLRNYHCAGRSVVVRLSSMTQPSAVRAMGHVARLKTTKPNWNLVTYAWLAPDVRDPVMMDQMLAELIEKTPVGTSLVCLTAGQKWLCLALAGRDFKAVSPNEKYLPTLKVPPESACYVLRRS